MDRIQFDAKVEEHGVLRIPDEYSHELSKGKDVHVTISDTSKENGTVKFLKENPLPVNADALPPGSRRTRLVERMIGHPFDIPGFNPLTRDEAHERDYKL